MLNCLRRSLRRIRKHWKKEWWKWKGKWTGHKFVGMLLLLPLKVTIVVTFRYNTTNCVVKRSEWKKKVGDDDLLVNLALPKYSRINDTYFMCLGSRILFLNIHSCNSHPSLYSNCYTCDCFLAPITLLKHVFHVVRFLSLSTFHTWQNPIPILVRGYERRNAFWTH